MLRPWRDSTHPHDGHAPTGERSFAQRDGLHFRVVGEPEAAYRARFPWDPAPDAAAVADQKWQRAFSEAVCDVVSNPDYGITSIRVVGATAAETQEIEETAAQRGLAAVHSANSHRLRRHAVVIRAERFSVN